MQDFDFVCESHGETSAWTIRIESSDTFFCFSEFKKVSPRRTGNVCCCPGKYANDDASSGLEAYFNGVMEKKKYIYISNIIVWTIYNGDFTQLS